MSPLDVAAVVFLLAGGFFFLAGTVGLLRFADTHSRLHAVTKADNVGLGLVVVGLLFLVSSWILAVKIIVVWVLVLVSSTTVCQLIAQVAHSEDGATEGPDDGS